MSWYLVVERDRDRWLGRSFVWWLVGGVGPHVALCRDVVPALEYLGGQFSFSVLTSDCVERLPRDE